ncbi:hypothetical protein OIO90_003712 [Microbotryomycetes sp. JL221]|nr:hypothetical protein OIO90_003712 [Microbotryomycetes sp. JL221]
MSRPPLLPNKTTAGISHSLEGDRIVAASRRPDGSVRKEIKIRPGYTPEEDVKKFRSQRMAEAEARAASRPRIPGLPSAAVQAALNGAARPSKSTSNSNRKDAAAATQRDGQGNNKKAGTSPVRESWDEDGADDVKQTASSTRSQAQTGTGGAESENAADKDAVESLDQARRIRAIKKKLRQAEALRERQQAGLYLPPSERAKADSVAELAEELAQLDIGSAS